MTRTLDPELSKRLADAVRELEARSCAEVVVEIRNRSGSYAHADARFASVFAFLGLLVLLFSPWPFQAAWVAVDVAILWVIGFFISRKSDAVRLRMTTKRERVDQAHTLAAAAFHERGIANTRAESGVLVFLSLLEGHLDLLADRGVLTAVPTLEWNQLMTVARARHATAETALRVVEELTPLLAKYLPSIEGDIDELENAPRFVSE